MVDDQAQIELKHYLLDLVTGERRDQIEQRIMTDQVFCDELETMEDDLIDEYLGGVLQGDERQRFEEYFLATVERQDSLRFGRALRRYVSGAETGQAARAFPLAARFWSTNSVVFPAAVAFIVLAVVVGGVWFYRNMNGPKNFATLTLTLSTANRAEGAQSTKIRIPPDVNALRISLLLPPGSDSAEGYRVALLNEKGETSSLGVMRQEDKRVDVTVPTSKLDRGQYALKLFRRNPDGTEQPVNGSYLFTVE
jgi:anti-sigma-K factor RskA